jgi:signal transduction histidine kinase
VIVPSDPPSDRRVPSPDAPAESRADLRARAEIGVLTGICAVVALAGSVATTDLAVAVVGAFLALGLAGTTGVIWSRALFPRGGSAAASAAGGRLVGSPGRPAPLQIGPPPHAAVEQGDTPRHAVAGYLDAPSHTGTGLVVAGDAVALHAGAPSQPAAPQTGLADPTLRAELDRMERRQQQDLAQRLHDGPLQHVVTALQDVTDLREGEDVDLAELELTLRQAIGGMREASTDLYDDVVRDAGLAAALGQVARSVERSGGPTVDVSVAAEASSEHDALVVAAARELLTNVRKHARASWAQVVVQRTRGGLLRLVVEDDGVGFDDDVRRAAAAQGHLGLRSVDDRARSAGGRLVAGNRLGAGVHDHGSMVQMLLPLDDRTRRALARHGTPASSRSTDAVGPTASRTDGGSGRLIGA